MHLLTYYKTVVKKAFLLSLIFFQIDDVKAQNSYGIMVGTGKSSLSRIQGSSEEVNNYSSTTSFWGGFTARFPLGLNGFSLSAATNYNKKGYRYNLQNATGPINTIKDSSFKQNLNYIDINLLLLKKFSLDEKTGFFIGLGPVMNVFISGKEEISKSYFGNALPIEKTSNVKLQTGSSAGEYKRIFPGLNLVAGMEYKRISLWVNYNLPLDHYYVDAARIQHQYSMKTFGVSVGYALFTGKHYEKEKKEKSAISVETVKKDTLTDTDGDGITDINDRCPGHKGIAKYGGCPIPDTDGDGINDDEDKCPLVEGSLATNGCPSFTEPVKPVSKDTLYFTVYFEPAKSVLRTQGFNTLSEVIKLLKANSKMHVIFKGHTDNVGSVEANSIRAFDRALVCADYVASFFINRNRLVVAAYGNKMPAADLNDRLQQWKNRRVEIMVFESNE